ncbi:MULTISPECIES: hypothetical protein [unclassified Pseudactinotalea]|uniref:hypothetical protein n=1 Tax=unclassified Pseudactinotalea TaxID=2649176 RepID=UPI00128D5DFB|nr:MULTISPECIES: hypothetical protein [unclassified Pseudactinotalea]MPV49573.1 hypothetical protein [Pseudactinotalea sp. HY160]QGH69874.1 hypothetical protein GCE65_10430 [Pseudactinotalea sp. HY158]
MRSRGGSIAYAAAMTALLALYIWIVGTRALVLIGSGIPVAVGIGVAVFVIPVVTVWFLVAEWRQAAVVSRMYATLEAEDGLVVDDLPRSRGGRIDKAAAAERFGPLAEIAEASPQDWRAWFNLGWAYDAAGDRRRARTTLRRAALMFRSESSARNQPG